MGTETKTNNRLWQARQKCNLEQKQIAFLLGHKTPDLVSRYERGAKTPGLRTALKLELILQSPVSRLFPEHFRSFRKELRERSNGVPSLFQTGAAFGHSSEQPEEPFHICTYETLLLAPSPHEKDVETARRHSIEMSRTLGEVIKRQRLIE